jgi:hypothetical protein
MTEGRVLTKKRIITNQQEKAISPTKRCKR